MMKKSLRSRAMDCVMKKGHEPDREGLDSMNVKLSPTALHINAAMK